MLGVLLFLWGRRLHAPTHVSDTAYDLLLSTLLSHRVPKVSVDRSNRGSIVYLMPGHTENLK